MSLVLLGILNSQVSGAVAQSSFELLDETVLTTTASSFQYSNLHTTYSDYTNLQVRCVWRTNRADFQSKVRVTFNGESTLYDTNELYGTGSGAAGGALDTDGSSIIMRSINAVPATNAYSNLFGVSRIDLQDFADVNKQTEVRWRYGTTFTGQTHASVQASGQRDGTAGALQTLTFVPQYSDSFVSGCRFSIYGIRSV